MYSNLLNTLLQVVRSVGLLGYLRVFASEHKIIESKPQNYVNDLRINAPFPALRSFVDSIDLSTVDDITHKHVPFLALLIKAADAWKAEV